MPVEAVITSSRPVEAPASPAREPRRRRRLGVVALVLIALASATVVQSFSWNQTSHYALVRSIAHGTPKIDRYEASTGDKARFHGHWYSSRAPGLALYSVPWYGLLTAVHAPSLALSLPAQRNADEMIWAVGLWGNVLPALVLLLLVRALADRVEPGYGTAASVTVGLGTLILPLGTLLFSHVLSACLGIAAFALLWRDRDGPGRLWRPALAGLLVGYGMTAEYPLVFVAIVLAAYLLVDAPRMRRALAYAGGVAVGLVPLAVFDQLAYGSVWHVAYADLPQHHAGFFGINLPTLSSAASLLFSSRGLLTLTPVLGLSIAGIVLLYRRGRRPEAVVIAAVALIYLAYNSGYYLPFGGAVPGPRFLTTILPFLGVPLAVAFRRLPAAAIALAAISCVTMVLATVTHPLVGYQPETAAWTRYAAKGFFQPTIVSAFGGGRGWVAVIPFAVFVLAALALTAAVTPPLELTRGRLAAAVAVAGGWALAASTLPDLLGIDRAAEHRIAESGDPMVVARLYGPHPLVHLSLLALGVALVALLVACPLRARPAPSRKHARAA